MDTKTSDQELLELRRKLRNLNQNISDTKIANKNLHQKIYYYNKNTPLLQKEIEKFTKYKQKYNWDDSLITTEKNKSEEKNKAEQLLLKRIKEKNIIKEKESRLANNKKAEIILLNNEIIQLEKELQLHNN